MKTNTKILAAVCAMFAIAACQKENLIDTDTPTQEGKVITLTVQDNISKTAYTPGTGVALTGTENIGLFYRKNETESTGRWFGMTTGESVQSKPVIATPSQGTYSFTIPAGAEYTEWTGILPYSAQNCFTTSNGKNMVVKLAPVQCPGANTFDPAYDYLLAKNFTIEEANASAQITQFVRIFTPLRLQIKGLAQGEKIYAVTFATNQTPSPDDGSLNMLVGQFMVNCSNDCTKAKITAVEQKDSDIAFGNAVSAVYSNGLEAVGESWPVWFMVNPSFIFNADCKVTVTVNTADAQYVRTITIPEETYLSKEQLNNITVNIKGEGYTKEARKVITQPFCKASNTSATASDGKSYTWTDANFWNAQGDSRDKGSLLPNGLNFTNKNAKIPAIPGYKVEKIRLYAHIVTNAKYATDSHLTLTYEGGGTKEYKYNFCSTDGTPKCLYQSGGILDIECPEGVDNLAGCTLTGANNCLASAVAFYVVEDKKEYEEATGNDLWTEFQAGKKITINGVEYTKDGYPNADLVDISTNLSDAQNAGLHFIEGTKTADNNQKLDGGAIWIGRYQDSKPELSASQVCFKDGSCVFHNISFKTTNGTCGFPNNNSPAANASLVFSHCTITATGGVIRDVNDTYCYESIVFDSCSISYNAKSLYFVNNKTATTETPKLFVLKDCTVNSTSTASVYVQSQNTDNLDIRFTGNTFTLNLGEGVKMFSIKSCKSLVYENNTGYDGELGAEPKAPVMAEHPVFPF